MKRKKGCLLALGLAAVLAGCAGSGGTDAGAGLPSGGAGSSETAGGAQEQQAVDAAVTADASVEAAVQESAPAAEAGAADGQAEGTALAAPPYEDPSSLPAYVYHGTEEYLDVISDYLVERSLEWGGEDDVYIPFSIITRVDDKDPEDIIAYGSYNIDGYKLRNSTLVSGSGSRDLGAFHLKKDAQGKAGVVSADLPEVEEDSVKLFSAVPGLFEETTALLDSKGDELQQEAIAAYVNTNALYISQWQDHGRAPVSVLNAPPTPEEENYYAYTSPLGYQMTYDLRRFSLMSDGNGGDLLGVVEPDDTWTGTLMAVAKAATDDAAKAIAEAIPDASAAAITLEKGSIGDGLACKKAVYDDPLEDGRIFRYVCYAVPADSGTITVLTETTVQKGVSELSVEGLEDTFGDVLSSFRVK